MTRLRRISLAAAALVLGVAGRSTAQDTTRTPQDVRLGLTYTPGSKPGLIVLPIAGPAGDSVRAILQRDFDYGDRINVIGADGMGFPEAPTAGRNGNYPVYAKLGAAALLQASLTPTGIHVALHDVAQQKIARVRDLPVAGAVNSREWRLMVHAVADEIENWVTGVRGIAATRIAYVSGGRVHVIDSDGAFATPVSEGGTALSPAWHPSGSQLVYSVLGPRGTQITVRDLATGGSRALPTTPGGLNITPTFSPDGGSIVYAHGAEDGTDLFSAPAAGGPARRITVGRGSDNTSPSFSPDGRRIAFTSGRSGHPEVYISDADGTNADLLTPYNFGDQSYRSSPDWSRDGRLIAFQSQIGGRFQIMTISLRDRTVKQWTSEGLNEDPSWAPDSRHIVFTSSRSGVKQLWVLDVESARVRQLTRTGGARLAAWSPSLRPR